MSSSIALDTIDLTMSRLERREHLLVRKIFNRAGQERNISTPRVETIEDDKFMMRM